MSPIRIAFLALAVLFVASQAHAFLGLFSSTPEVQAQNGRIEIPVKDVSDGKARHYRYIQDGREVTFFLLKTGDGVIRAAFDACDVCYHAGKGYSQDKDFMICNNCGMKFHASRIGEVEGGCNPAPLERVIEGDKVVIETGAVIAGQRFFQ